MEEVSGLRVLPESEWLELASQHKIRAEALTANWRKNHAAGLSDPIEDFLFQYYSYRPTLLTRWHPGAGVALAGAACRSTWRYYQQIDDQVSVNVAEFVAERGGAMDFIENLLQSLIDSSPKFGCFGLHEWAMVYRLTAEQIRHKQLPLRLSSAETDQVVESHKIICSHYDAFRFFTPEAKPRNLLQPNREQQELFEQPGCLHAGMDSYKWAIKLGAIIPGDLLLDTFELAKDIRYTDMQASPYDLSLLGFDAIPIETSAGKREYTRLQREYSERALNLRKRIVTSIQTARAQAASQLARV